MLRSIKFFLFILFCLTEEDVISQNKAELDSLTSVLEKALEKDQVNRIRLDSIQKKYGMTSPETDSCWKIINRTDSLNTIIIISVLDKYGWPNINETSILADAALFTILQHANVETQKRYLPILEKAVMEGKTKKTHYPYLYDRICMHSDKYQLYGTQIGGDYKGDLIIWPIRKASTVNERRKEFNLAPIEQYSKKFNIDYVVPKSDSLDTKISLTVIIYNRKKKLAKVQLLSSKKREIFGTSNKSGAIQAAIDRDEIRDYLILKKKGYKKQRIYFQDMGKDVFFMTVKIKKKLLHIL